jgi:uncharacterized protein
MVYHARKFTADSNDMRLLTLVQMVALIGITAGQAFAQTNSAAPTQDTQLKTIPVKDAERHLIDRKTPEYPPIAKLAHVEGSVRLTLEVNSAGMVVRVANSSGPALLVRAAIEAAEQYRYRPFDVNGAPTAVLVEAVIQFSLLGGPPNPRIPFPEVTDLDLIRMGYEDGCIDIDVGGNGIVRYTGTCDAAVQGKHELHIRPDEVERLLGAFRGADFFSLRDDYSVAASDTGSERTSIRIGNLEKAITDNYIQVPVALKDVQNAVQKYSHSNQWTKGNRHTVPDLLAEAHTPEQQRNLLSAVLPYAALYSDVSVVRAILSQPIDPNRQGPFNNTALMLAAGRGSPDMVSALLKADANPHAVDEFGCDALIFGAGSGNRRVVQILLAAGLKATASDKYGDTALMAAAATGNAESVGLLLKNRADVNERNQRRQTALLSGATGDSGFSVMEMGRRHAEVPEKSIHRGRVVKLLLEAGADINARGWNGETALFSLDEGVVREVIRHGANLEARDNYGRTALIETVSGSIAEILIAAGADVNAKDNDGKTALIAAAESNFVDKLMVLVKAPGIRLEERDNQGETALMKARAKNLQDGVRVLVSAGEKE